MHSIQYSFYARFGNPVNEVLCLPNWSIVRQQFGVIYNKPLRRNSYETVSSGDIKKKEGYHFVSTMAVGDRL